MAASTVQAVPNLYDVIMWLMGRVEKFPRSQKFTLGDRIVNIALDTLDILIKIRDSDSNTGSYIFRAITVQTILKVAYLSGTT